jgi:hypothetical protein
VEWKAASETQNCHFRLRWHWFVSEIAQEGLDAVFFGFAETNGWEEREFESARLQVKLSAQEMASEWLENAIVVRRGSAEDGAAEVAREIWMQQSLLKH